MRYIRELLNELVSEYDENSWKPEKILEGSREGLGGTGVSLHSSV